MAKIIDLTEEFHLSEIVAKLRQLDKEDMIETRKNLINGILMGSVDSPYEIVGVLEECKNDMLTTLNKGKVELMEEDENGDR